MTLLICIEEIATFDSVTLVIGVLNRKESCSTLKAWTLIKTIIFEVDPPLYPTHGLTT